MKKSAWLLVVIPVMIVALAVFPATAGSSSPPSAASYVPQPVSTGFNMVVTIPDPNLRAELHDLTGVPDNESLHLADLWVLTGSINVSDKNIANADGIQHCINITYLDMSRNPITNLPSMAGMTKLKTLRLSGCGLDEWPAGKLPPNLQTLSFSKNNISELPDMMMDPPGTWKNLDLNSNNIKELPDWLLSLPGLIMLDLSHNDLGEVPEGISGLTHLEQLYVSDNGLEALPDVLCDMPNLHDLVAARNSIYSLPEDIGDHLYTLSVPYNRIETLPVSIGDSPSLYLIDVMLNRLKSLPANFDDHEWDFINVEFNFIDMSPGTAERTMIDNMDTNMEKYYKRQLTPVTNLTAVPGSDSITLTWEGGVDGAEGGATWTVAGYVVYLYDGSMVKLADVDADTLTYTVTSLTPETEYQYRVGIDYDVEAPAWGYDVSTRAYTRITATTTAAEPSPTAAEATPAAATPTISAAPSAPAATQEAQPAEGSAASQAMPLWLIVAIAAVGALALGAGATLLILKLKKK